LIAADASAGIIAAAATPTPARTTRLFRFILLTPFVMPAAVSNDRSSLARLVKNYGKGASVRAQLRPDAHSNVQ
jgi:hypothetical protein